MRRLGGFGVKAREYQRIRVENKRLKRENNLLKWCLQSIGDHHHEAQEHLHEVICLPLWRGEGIEV